MPDTIRRLLVKRYLELVAAERLLMDANHRAAGMFPGGDTHLVMHIGNSGSRIRQLYERREKALQKLHQVRSLMKSSERRTPQTVYRLTYMPA
ncbi:hypothetical protein [Roseivivax sp. CAU 1761]